MKRRKGRRRQRRANQTRKKENRARNKINFGVFERKRSLAVGRFPLFGLGNFALQILLFFCAVFHKSCCDNQKPNLHFYVLAFLSSFCYFSYMFLLRGNNPILSDFVLCSSSAERRSLALRKGNRAAHNKQTENERERTEGRRPTACRTNLRRD